jgi:hypothetical protein
MNDIVTKTQVVKIDFGYAVGLAFATVGYFGRLLPALAIVFSALIILCGYLADGVTDIVYLVVMTGLLLVESALALYGPFLLLSFVVVLIERVRSGDKFNIEYLDDRMLLITPRERLTVMNTEILKQVKTKRGRLLVLRLKKRKKIFYIPNSAVRSKP